MIRESGVETMGRLLGESQESLAELTNLLKRVERLSSGTGKVTYWNPRERQWNTRYVLGKQDREARYLYRGPSLLDALKKLLEEA